MSKTKDEGAILSERSVVHQLANAFNHFGARPALKVGRNIWSYDQLAGPVFETTKTLEDQAGDQPLVGVLCARNQNAYAAILAVLMSGRGYVPLNPKLPMERLQKIVQASGIKTVLIEPKQISLAGQINPDLSVIELVLRADASARPIPWDYTPPKLSDGDIAYLLFTSGSTGEPKGVAVSHGNLRTYVGTVNRLYAYVPDDVHSQTFELTFDLSVHDMMCAFTTGGCLVRMSGAELLSPLAVIRKQGITCWFSVPSLASMLATQGALTDGSAAGLRVSLFCGEALPVSVANAWLRAAPNAVLENLYGPTEATIAFTRQRWSAAGNGQARLGLVPIGAAFAGQETAIIDAQDRVQPGVASGELLLSGAQVTGAYWHDPDNTYRRYLELDGRRWYRTGDLVEQGEDGTLYFVGRLDSQIKFRGYRIELREIENALSQIIGSELVVVLPWPKQDQEIKALTAIVAIKCDAGAVLQSLRSLLPDYMIPSSVRYIETFPKNMSGKVDRNALTAWLEDSLSSDQ